VSSRSRILSGAITAAPLTFIGATANVARNQQFRTARLLDRFGKGLAVPVTASVRADTDGKRWQVARDNRGRGKR
jgi:hypothetical protein